ncbi:MAG: hypothetical protein KDC59_22730 [Saprospiraceae bacterium]|nr:hypothetical protein [Saprospiraceae bacterium]
MGFGFSPMAPQAMALDSREHALFWTDIGTNQIFRSALVEKASYSVTMPENLFGIDRIIQSSLVYLSIYNSPD